METTRVLRPETVAHLVEAADESEAGAFEVAIVVRTPAGAPARDEAHAAMLSFAESVAEQFDRFATHEVSETGLSRGNEKTDDEFTESEVAALRRAGVKVDTITAGSSEAIERAIDRYADLVANAVPLAAVAGRLGVTDGRLRQRIAKRELFAIQGRRVGWRVPTWQIDGDGLVPGVGKVLKALPDDAHPLTVSTFFLTPNPDLSIEGEPVSPIDWLRSGGQPAIAAQLAEDFPAAT